MNKRLQHSGYNTEFRKQITKSALNKYNEIKEKDKRGECPYVQEQTVEKIRKGKEETQQQNYMVQEEKRKQKQKLQICAIHTSNAKVPTTKAIYKNNKQA